MVTPMIVNAAIITAEGVIYEVPRPGRHHDVIRLMTEQGVSPKMCQQGFTTTTGSFVGREEARIIAEEHDLLLPRASTGNKLFSEDLW